MSRGSLHVVWEEDEDGIRIESPCFCSKGETHKAGVK